MQSKSPWFVLKVKFSPRCGVQLKRNVELNAAQSGVELAERGREAFQVRSLTRVANIEIARDRRGTLESGRNAPNDHVVHLPLVKDQDDRFGI